jgi:hypothetical protein
VSVHHHNAPPLTYIICFVPASAYARALCAQVRSLRILRAAKVLPKLMLVLETLIASVSSVAYIALFILLVSYIFAIVAGKELRKRAFCAPFCTQH